jgi:hypothetical protein
MSKRRLYWQEARLIWVVAKLDETPGWQVVLLIVANVFIGRIRVEMTRP